MSIRSRKIELAVSTPPAPRPIIVCVPECSDVNAIAFNVPFTPKGSSFGISFGLTINSLSQEAINFNTELFINSFRVFDQIIDTRMNEDGIIEILTDIGMARIQVIDSTGSISGNGEIIIRKLDTNNDEFLVTAWNGSDVSIMLPEGRYSAILESENIQGETEFEIFGDEKDVLIVVDSVYGMSLIHI